MPHSLTNIYAKRNAFLLAIAQAFGATAAPIAISAGGIVGFYLLADDKSLASAPVTGYNIGVALGALPAALLMGRLGRRVGLISGGFVGIFGGLAAMLAIMQHNFWLFCLALICSGIGGSFAQQYRFAATDEGSNEYKPRAIAWVLSGGIVAAIIGPQASIYFRNFFTDIDYAGSFLAGSVLICFAIVALCFLRFTEKNNQTKKTNKKLKVRSTTELMQSPIFLVSLLCAVSTYSLMSFVMTAAPLAMMEHGHSFEDSTNGIMIHVIAMFAPSFITGRLIGYFGKEKIVATGVSLLAICALVALSGVQLFHFWFSLVLLGVGWNFGFIGATAMLATAHASHEKAKVQGIHDLILFSFVAFASLMAGFTLNGLGWAAINMGVFPFVILCLLSLAWIKNRKVT